MSELKGHQPTVGDRGKLQFHSRLMLMECTFASLKVRNLKVHMLGTYQNLLMGVWVIASVQLLHMVLQ